MKKGIYQTINANGMHFKNIKTNQIYENQLDLYHYTADDNNIYYKKPVYDNYKDFFVSTDNINWEPLEKRLNLENQNFLIIGGQGEVFEIYKFKLPICNNWSSLYINKDMHDFLSTLDLSKVKYKSSFLSYDVMKYVLALQIKGNEIIFFLYSEDNEICKKIKEKQIEIFSLNLLTRSYNFRISHLNMDLKNEANYVSSVLKYIKDPKIKSLCFLKDDLFVYGNINDEIKEML